MSFWLKIDNELLDQYEEMELLDLEDVPIQLSLNLAHEAMNEYAFQYIVVETLRKMYGPRGDYLTVGYLPPREDNITGIQAAPNSDGKFWVEILAEYDDGEPFHTYCKKNVSFRQTVRYFREILVDYVCPDLTEWDEVTELVKEEQKRRGLIDET